MFDTPCTLLSARLHYHRIQAAPVSDRPNAFTSAPKRLRRSLLRTYKGLAARSQRSTRLRSLVPGRPHCCLVSGFSLGTSSTKLGCPGERWPAGLCSLGPAHTRSPKRILFFTVNCFGIETRDCRPYAHHLVPALDTWQVVANMGRRLNHMFELKVRNMASKGAWYPDGSPRTPATSPSSQHLHHKLTPFQSHPLVVRTQMATQLTVYLRLMVTLAAIRRSPNEVIVSLLRTWRCAGISSLIGLLQAVKTPAIA